MTEQLREARDLAHKLARVLDAMLDEPASLEEYAFPISAIDLRLLQMMAPHAVLDDLERWVEPIKAACALYRIDSIRRVSAFLTTLAHEGQFKIGARENMSYSAKRLSQVWPSRYGRGAPNAKAKELSHNPEALANDVYANRMGNGPPESGDGWKFRGNGPTQLTGRDNHEAFAKAIGKPLEETAAYIGTLEGGVMSAAWFWNENGINELADTPGVEDETRRINGGLIGIHERRALFNKCVAELLKREAAQ